MTWAEKTESKRIRLKNSLLKIPSQKTPPESQFFCFAAWDKALYSEDFQHRTIYRAEYS
jgi:hypothetical protein